MKYWLDTNLPNVDKCLVKKKESAAQKPIKLVDLTSAFFVLGVGLSLSLICFVSERIYFNLHRRKVNRTLHVLLFLHN